MGRDLSPHKVGIETLIVGLDMRDVEAGLGDIAGNRLLGMKETRRRTGASEVRNRVGGGARGGGIGAVSGTHHNIYSAAGLNHAMKLGEGRYKLGFGQVM